MNQMKIDRPLFVKTSAIGAAALALGGTSSLTSAKEERSARTQFPEYNPKFGVYDEAKGTLPYIPSMSDGARRARPSSNDYS